MEKCDVLIIGGGPSGSVAAASLVQQGYDVTVIEKEEFPRFVIGESLLPRCNEILEKNNMLEDIQKQGYIVKGGAMFSDKDDNFLKVDFDHNIGQKWGSTFQVKREEFDHVLLKTAAKLGAKVHHKNEVTGYDNDNNVVTAKDENGNTKEYKAKFVIDASGYGRVLPKIMDLDIPSELKLRNAIFTRIEGDIRREGYDEGYIDIFIYGDNEAWIWVIPFSDGITSVGIVCEEEFFLNHKMSNEEFWDHIIQSDPNAKERFKNAKKIAPVGRIDGYSAAIKKMYGKGFALCGNATEFLDPVFSSGVTLALESGDRLAYVVGKELKGEDVDWQKDYEDYMMIGVNVFREFVLAWYDGRLHKVFFHDDKEDLILRSISSILGGYVWDERNMFVRNAKSSLNSLIGLIDTRNNMKK